jgi:hypothetical protein
MREASTYNLHDLVVEYTSMNWEPNGGAIAVWGSRWRQLAAGDFLIIRHVKNDRASDTARYRVIKVRPCSDPRDMAFIDVVFDPRYGRERESA